MYRQSTITVIIPFAVWLILFAGCAGTNISLNSAQKINQLQPGMSYDDVVAILGKSKTPQIVGDKLIARWVLQEKGVGYVPYDLAFDSETKQLISWYRNQEDFKKKQEKIQEYTEILEESINEASGNGNAPLTGPNDVNLQRQFAVKLYRFSAVGGGQTGGTETIINLCPDGKLYSSGETGYSGEGWGTASQGSDAGTWRIQGNMQQGKIVTVQNGQAWEYTYTRGGDYVMLGSTKYAIAGRPDCY